MNLGDPGRRRLLGRAVLALAVALQLGGMPTGVAATTYSSTWSNVTAFDICTGGTFAQQAYTLAMNGFGYLTYYRYGFTGTGFTRTAFLNRVSGDRGIFVRSHGDYYNPSGAQGFREDAGLCSGSGIVNSNDVHSRVTTPAQVVIMSTCVLGEIPTNGTLSMSAAFGIPQNKSASAYVFYMGYKGHPYTSDMTYFESDFWTHVEAGCPGNPMYSLAEAYQWAKSLHSTFTAPEWYGSPYYTGWADMVGCTRCV